MDFREPEHVVQLRDSLRRFVADEMPREAAQRWDRDDLFPREEFQKLLGGELPIGEIYLQSDPPRMFKVIKASSKPCLAYKVLAAGRKIEKPEQVRQCFETAFSNVKPTDAVIVGMYQQLGDQVGENTGFVRDICTDQHSR